MREPTDGAPYYVIDSDPTLAKIDFGRVLDEHSKTIAFTVYDPPKSAGGHTVEFSLQLAGGGLTNELTGVSTKVHDYILHPGQHETFHLTFHAEHYGYADGAPYLQLDWLKGVPSADHNQTIGIWGGSPGDIG